MISVRAETDELTVRANFRELVSLYKLYLAHLENASYSEIAALPEFAH
jgi:hypothetical protein